MSKFQNDYHTGFRPDLQGLRAVAMILVVLAHAGVPHLLGGFIGVDVFFVLSGYLITCLLLNELEQTGTVSLLNFYARRLRRLLPALLFMLLVIYGLTIELLSSFEAPAQLRSSLYAITWTSNLLFANANVNYFDELAGRDLFLHTWSLGVEEQFYLVWPIFLFMVFKFGNLHQMIQAQRVRFVAIALTICFLISLGLYIYWTINEPRLAFYLMPSRIWQFALGAIGCLVLSKMLFGPSRLNMSQNRILGWPVLLVGLTMIFGSALVIHPSHSYPGLMAAVPSLGALLVIVSGQALPKRCNPLAHPIMIWLGDRSYSLYLWHWPFLILGFSLGFQDQPVAISGLVLLSLLSAVITYRLIELPFWKGRFNTLNQNRQVALSLLAMFAVLISFMAYQHKLSDTMAAVDKLNVWRNDSPEIYKISCDAFISHARVEPCVFGSNSSKKSVVLLGDSIGVQWFSSIHAIFGEPLWRTVVLTKSSCAMVDELWFYERIGRYYVECQDWRNAVLNELEKIHPDVLIVGSAAVYGFSESSWVEGSARVLQRLSKSAGRVYVIAPTPTLSFNGPNCLEKNILPGGGLDHEACVEKDGARLVETVSSYLKQASDRFPNVRMVNLNGIACPNGSCNAVSEEGLVVFRDAQHLTDSYVRSRISLIRDQIESVNW